MATTPRIFSLTLITAGLCACAGPQDSTLASRQAAEPWTQPVPRAQCGVNDAQETGFQGQVSLVDRLSGRSLQPYNCNLELVGQHQGEGSGWSVTIFDDCAYYSQVGSNSTTTSLTPLQNPGAVALDMSDSANPVATAYLDSPGIADPHESMKVNERRALLGAGQNAGPAFDLYDISGDCRQPKLLASVDMGGEGHEGDFSADGHTYYIANTSSTMGITVQVVDVSDPTNPALITEAVPRPSHGVTTSPDGNRAYLTGIVGDGSNGLTIVDTSQVQARVPDPEIAILGELGWNDGLAAQHAIHVNYDGRPHVIFVDELGGGALAFVGLLNGLPSDPPQEAFLAGLVLGPPIQCINDEAPFGMARIIDISDEANPKLTAKLMLETNDAANCAETLADVSGQAIFSYDSHYCAVDRIDNPTAVACGYQNSGIRVFDIRDPYAPREIAYYIPPGRIDQQHELAGSSHLGAKNADWCSNPVHFVPERGELWTSCQDNGFIALRFTNGVWPFPD